MRSWADGLRPSYPPSASRAAERARCAREEDRDEGDSGAAQRRRAGRAGGRWALTRSRRPGGGLGLGLRDALRRGLQGLDVVAEQLQALGDVLFVDGAI